MHHRHNDVGARMFWTGALAAATLVLGDARRRGPLASTSPSGIIDLSTLGKILVKGPDAGAFLDRLYPNRFSDLKVGRIRYGVLATTQVGSWTTARSRGSATTSST